MPVNRSDMSLSDVLKTTNILAQGVLKLAVIICDSENLHAELKETAKFISTDLTVIGGILDNLQNFSQRVSIQDEIFLCKNIELLKSIITNAQTVLEEVQRDRNFVQRLFMKKDDYRRQLHDISKRLNNSCMIIQGALPAITKIEIPRREFSDFRRIFQHTPDKTISFYNFSIIKNTFHSVQSITFEEFDSKKYSCYMKFGNEQFFFSYQLRTWSALDPKPFVFEQRRRDFREKMRNSNNSSPIGNYLPIGFASSIQSSVPPPSSSADANNLCNKLDFSEFFMAHDDICGMALTQSTIYIATKHEITIVSLKKQKIIAQHGILSDGPNSFNHISHIYIPSNDEASLYIVDRGQYAVHRYRIDDSGVRFDFVRRYIIIANVNQQCNLISCTIFNQHLYVSDNANNCLHIFPLNGDRQSSYLTDNLLTPFSPGSLCAHGKYLYVANCSIESPGILVFNEECQPIDWFRNRSIQEILSIDIDPNINELYILTTITTKNANNTFKKRPLSVSMDLVIRT